MPQADCGSFCAFRLFCMRGRVSSRAVFTLSLPLAMQVTVETGIGGNQLNPALHGLMPSTHEDGSRAGIFFEEPAHCAAIRVSSLFFEPSVLVAASFPTGGAHARSLENFVVPCLSSGGVPGTRYYCKRMHACHRSHRFWLGYESACSGWFDRWQYRRRGRGQRRLQWHGGRPVQRRARARARAAPDKTRIQQRRPRSVRCPKGLHRDVLRRCRGTGRVYDRGHCPKSGAEPGE